MVFLNNAIDSILQGFFTNEFRFLFIEFSQEFLHKLFPVKEMLPDLSVQLRNSPFLHSRTDTLFIDEFVKFILNLLCDLLIFREQDIINLLFDNIDVSLIESLMLI